MFNIKNNQLFIEGIAVEDIIKTHQTPFYLYSQEIIAKTYNELVKTLKTEIFYSVKANSNQAIIKLMYSLGAGVDVVSIGELKRVLNAGVAKDKIIFEGVGKSNEDILFAINQNIRLINAESIDELYRINSIALSINKIINIGLRINPNVDGRTLDKISTGKKTDKFGISIEEFPNLIKVLNKLKNIKIISISSHIGSQIFDIEVFKNLFEVMKKIAEDFLKKNIQIKYIDLGGGFGVKYSSKDPTLKLEDLKKIISSCFDDAPYNISFEPGRYLVAKAGFLITKIITTKSNGGVNYLITDAGMNTFIRPSLYDAIHKIEAVNQLSKVKSEYTIAGPICESSDILAKNIILPNQKNGDYLIIHDVGAYGAVMASDYNSRGMPSEILVNGSSLAIIHKPQKIEEKIDQDIVPTWLDSN